MANKLQQTRAELDRSDPSWRLEDIEAARDEVPEEQNSARVVIAAAQQMPSPWPSAGFPQEYFQNLPSNEMLNGEDYARLSGELASAQTSLMLARKLADMPSGRHWIHYESNPTATLLPHLQESRNLVTFLVYESMRQNQQGDSKSALTACRAALNTARSIGDEPIFISQLVRNACVVHVCQAIERTLGQGEPPPEDMSLLQKMLESEDAFPALPIATRGVRALLDKVFEGLERGEFFLDELDGLHQAGGQLDWLKNNVVSLGRMDTRQDHALFLSLMTRRLQEVQFPMHEQAERESQFERDVQKLPKAAVVTRLLLRSLTGWGESFRCKHAYLRSTIIALAAERYRCHKQAWPDNIDKICPSFLATVPLDPYNGKPLRYKRGDDGVVVYCAGQDSEDNGGKISREHLYPRGMDIGVRLWDTAQRRRLPRPNPLQEKQSR